MSNQVKPFYHLLIVIIILGKRAKISLLVYPLPISLPFNRSYLLPFEIILNNKLKNSYLDWYLCRIFCKCRKFKILKDQKLIMMDSLLSTVLMSYKPSGWRQVLHELHLNSNWFGVPSLILDWNNPWLGLTYLHVKLQITRGPFPQELDGYVNKKKLNNKILSWK